MTYQEGRAGLQLVAEQEIGTLLRRARAQEDASLNRSLEALRREQQEMLP